MSGILKLSEHLQEKQEVNHQSRDKKMWRNKNNQTIWVSKCHIDAQKPELQTP